ncbi:MAG: hypothetical protein NT015_10180 [Alphaproteobacteria bacterium]|nr:hypothetical protein [Alphaproteobacteria bacterium]
MNVAAGVAIAVLVLVLAYLWNVHDLRGWEPDSYSEDPTLILATLPGKPSFTFADCLPGAINDHALPSSEEYSGSGSLPVFTCRSRSSALTILLTYIALAASALFAFHLVRSKRGARVSEVQ